MATAATTIDLSDLRSVTNDAYWPYLSCPTRNMLLWGGAGSGKSVFSAQKYVVRCMEEFHHVGCFRKVGRTLKTSVFAQTEEAIYSLGVEDLWEDNKTDLTWIYRPNRSIMRCLGLDDVMKLKSIVRLTDGWLEEATEMVPYDYEQINLRLRGRTRGYKQITLTFNPITILHWIKKHFFDLDQHGRTAVLHTTYKDNRFLDPEYVRELELLIERDPDLGRVYTRGEWGKLVGTIYAAFLEDEWPAASTFQDRIYCVDWGFENPMVLLRLDLRELDVYVTELVYQSGMTAQDLAKRMTDLKVEYSAPVYCDPSDPGRIETLRRAGFNARAADNDVASGIDRVKSMRIHTRPGNRNLNAENATYCWRKNAAGDSLDVPEKQNDHAMDALRYGVYSHFKKGPLRFIDRRKFGA